MWIKNLNVLRASLKFCGYFFEDQKESKFVKAKAAKFYSYCLTFYRIAFLTNNLIFATMFYLYGRQTNRLMATVEFLLTILFNFTSIVCLLVLQTKTEEIGRLGNKITEYYKNRIWSNCVILLYFWIQYTFQTFNYINYVITFANSEFIPP